MLMLEPRWKMGHWRVLLCLGALPLPSKSGLFDGEDPGGAAPSLVSLEPKHWSRHLGRASCELPAGSGRVNGVCVDDIREIENNISFCRSVVQYRACVPSHQPLWPDWNATKKDRMLARLYKEIVEKRLAKEMNVTPKIYVEIHLLSNADCFSALKNALCWYNFPKCSDQNVSLPLCQQSCENFYTACNYKAAGSGTEHKQCSASAIKQNGLFGSGAPGNGQHLAEDNTTCESTASKAAEYEQGLTQSETWLLTPPGLALMGFGGLLLFGAAYLLLVPYGLRVYISWALRQTIAVPMSWFRKIPAINGVRVILFTAFVFLGLVGFGIYTRSQGGNSLSDRFGRDFKTETNDDGTLGFKPEVATKEVMVSTELTNKQMSRLIGSCGCTGDR